MRCERFVEELESYAKQVEEFYSYGDLQEVNRYLKKAQALNAKLDAAADKVKFPVALPDGTANLLCGEWPNLVREDGFCSQKITGSTPRMFY